MERLPVGSVRSRYWLFLSVVWLASAWYTGARLYRGWVPHDDGCIAEGAVRVLHGQLPHRDYIDLYTGGLSYLGALTFKVIGQDFVSLRIVMFVVFLAWVPSVFFIASQFAKPWVAAGLTFLSVVWSVPNYPAPMPSWYNLFFATFGIAALLAFLKHRTWRWLFFAGLAGGASCLVKITGIYYVSAVLLFFIFYEQGIAGDQKVELVSDRSPVFSILTLTALVGFVLVLVRLVHSGATDGEDLHFTLPNATLAVLLAYRELGVRGRTSVQRLAGIWKLIAPFGVGVLLPIVAFCAVYIRSHSMLALYRGVFVLPFLRIGNTARHPVGLSLEIFELPIFLVLSLAFLRFPPVRWTTTILATVVSVLLGIFAFRHVVPYRIVWFSITLTIPFGVVASASRLAWFRARSTVVSSSRQRILFLLSAMAALCSVIEFPAFYAVYFLYVAPLSILLLAALVTSLQEPPRALMAMTAAFLCFFAILVFSPGYVYHMGRDFSPETQTVRMTIPVAERLRVAPDVAQTYQSMTEIVRDHLNGGGLLAGPDCPEVYVLLGAPNPTHASFDFFEDLPTYESYLRGIIQTNSVRVVVINDYPVQSVNYVKPLRRVVTGTFPNEMQVGKFEIYWRP